MVVNELIAELQVLSAQGHGELDVVITEDDGCGLTWQTTNVKLHLVSKEHFESNGWYLKNYWKVEENNDTGMVRNTPFLFIGRV